MARVFRLGTSLLFVGTVCTYVVHLVHSSLCEKLHDRRSQPQANTGNHDRHHHAGRNPVFLVDFFGRWRRWCAACEHDWFLL
ncbi:hypothetical protein V1506DRAFT_546876, partial [Lipomyces tetrasporus]